MSTNGHNGVMPWTKRVLADGAASVQALRIRLDSWANALTGLNTSRDKSTSTLPYVEAILSPLTLEVMYHTSDIAARIVTAVPDECFREPWHVYSESADDADKDHQRADDLESDLIRLDVRSKFHDAFVWGRLYGQGAVLIGADDGRPMWEPLDYAAVKSVDYLTVFDKRDLIPWRWYTEIQSPKFGEIALFQLQPVGVYIGAPYERSTVEQPSLVHESRLIQFGGELTSRRERLRNQGVDYSILQKCFRALQLTDNNWQSVSALLSDASQGVFKIKGLIDMVSQQPDVMQTRMALVDQLRSAVRAIVLDADGEDFTRVSTPFAGIPDILDQTWKRLAAAAHMPLTVLMGMSPGGMNATGESDMRWWYDTIAATQRQIVQPNMEHLLEILASARGYDNPQDWSIRFAPLWQLNASEKAELQERTAKRDQIYIQEGVLRADEVAISRFGGGEWDDNTTIDVDSRKKALELSIKNPPQPTAPDKTTGDPARGTNA